MFTMAKVGQYVTDWAGDPGAVTSFKTRFTKPVVVPADRGNSVTVAGKVVAKDGSTATLELTATSSEGENVAQAQAVVKLA